MCDGFDAGRKQGGILVGANRLILRLNRIGDRPTLSGTGCGAAIEVKEPAEICGALRIQTNRLTKGRHLKRAVDAQAIRAWRARPPVSATRPAIRRLGA